MIVERQWSNAPEKELEKQTSLTRGHLVLQPSLSMLHWSMYTWVMSSADPKYMAPFQGHQCYTQTDLQLHQRWASKHRGNYGNCGKISATLYIGTHVCKAVVLSSATDNSQESADSGRHLDTPKNTHTQDQSSVTCYNCIWLWLTDYQPWHTSGMHQPLDKHALTKWFHSIYGHTFCLFCLHCVYH
jgi:hypothetical protein